jgi:hypothetical protein
MSIFAVIAIVAIFLASALGGSVSAQTACAGEEICVKYGPCRLDLKKNGFECTETTSSSFVRRVCHDNKHRFLAIQLNDTWYPYCEVDVLDVLQLVAAPSIGRHYNENIRSRSRFDCRNKTLPDYPTCR